MNKRERLRDRIFNKFGGRCAYCGCELQKGWHVDEVKPVRRNGDGTCLHPENFNEDNQYPSCPSCNINKHSMGLEDFRGAIKRYVVSLNKHSTQYKMAKKFNLIMEINTGVEFYFERYNLKS